MSCGKVLIVLPMLVWLLLTKTKISKTKAKINNPNGKFSTFDTLNLPTRIRKLKCFVQPCAFYFYLVCNLDDSMTIELNKHYVTFQHALQDE